MNSAVIGGAVEIAAGIEDQFAAGSGPVRTIPEAVDHLLVPVAVAARQQLEDSAEVVDASLIGRAIKIALGIEHQSGLGLRSIVTVIVKAMNHALGPSTIAVGRQLIRGSVAVNPTVVAGTVQVARSIHDQTGLRIHRLRLAQGKTVQQLFLPASTLQALHLENRAVAVQAAILRGAVKVSIRIHHQAGGWTC